MNCWPMLPHYSPTMGPAWWWLPISCTQVRTYPPAGTWTRQQPTAQHSFWSACGPRLLASRRCAAGNAMDIESFRTSVQSEVAQATLLPTMTQGQI